MGCLWFVILAFGVWLYWFFATVMIELHHVPWHFAYFVTYGIPPLTFIVYKIFFQDWKSAFRVAICILPVIGVSGWLLYLPYLLHTSYPFVLPTILVLLLLVLLLGGKK